jgi:hypothetical protein
VAVPSGYVSLFRELLPKKTCRFGFFNLSNKHFLGAVPQPIFAFVQVYKATISPSPNNLIASARLDTSTGMSLQSLPTEIQAIVFPRMLISQLVEYDI